MVYENIQVNFGISRIENSWDFHVHTDPGQIDKQERLAQSTQSTLEYIVRSEMLPLELLFEKS